MKTDRELLELAAKAAGYAVDWREWVRSHVAEFATVKHVKCAGFWLDGKEWNPLNDDGDALRLAVALRFSVFAGCDWCTVRGGTKKVKSDTRFKIYEHIGWDEYDRRDRAGATRRAITRAAAAIGEGE